MPSEKVLSRLICATVVTIVAAPGADRRAQSRAYTEVRDVPHGSVEQVVYTSGALNFPQAPTIYAPRGHETSAAPRGHETSAGRCPVVCLLHGAGGDEGTWTERGSAHVIPDDRIAKGRSTFGYEVVPVPVP